MLPSRKENIYPYNKDNILALLNHYFDIELGDIDWILKHKKIALNQLEIIAMKVSEQKEFFKSEFPKNGRTVSNLMMYGVDAIFHEMETLKKENERKRITRDFLDLLNKKN